MKTIQGNILQNILLSFILGGFTLSGQAFATNNDILGTFESKLSNEKSNVTLRLECETETNCKLTTIMQVGENTPTQDIQIMKKVLPVKDLTYAANALRYAIKVQDFDMKSKEDIEMMRNLKPALPEGQSLVKCWDLNYPTPEYSLACTFSKVPTKNPPVFLFFSLIANSCSGAFCAYTIIPMSRQEK